MEINKCDTCLTCKMQKCAKGHGDTCKDAVMKPKNHKRTQKLTSIDGSQSYLLAVYHYSDWL
eukprot:13908122-Ditylum_brightwellii.AAC.1